MLKLAAVFPGLSLLGRVFTLEARPLASVFIIFLMVLLLAGVALYLLERAGQPEQFGSLPLALWWAVDDTHHDRIRRAVPANFPWPPYRRHGDDLRASGCSGWTGILATGFAAEHRRREFIRNWDMVTRVPFCAISCRPPSSS